MVAAINNIPMTRQVRMEKNSNWFNKIVIPIAIVLFAFIVMMVLVNMRAAPKKAPPGTEGVLVKTGQVISDKVTIEVRATGNVRATQEVSVIPQVSGVVKETAPDFVEGGFFKKGQELFRIDGTDYQLALRSAEAVEAQAEVELETIKSRADIARREWEIMSRGTLDPSAPNPLALYGPQMKNARAMMESAAAKVEQARLNLKRTVLRAPFDCRLRSKAIDTGQYVRSGNPVAVLAGTASAEVVIPLEREELKWLTLPGPAATGGKGPLATVGVPGTEGVWNGRVMRTLGEVDMKSRMVQVVVKVDDPYGIASGQKDGLPLMNGSFVSVSIRGKTLERAFIVPRQALRDDNTIWVMDSAGELRITPVNVVRVAGDSVIVDKGLNDNDRIVLSKVSGAADGMKLRTQEDKKAPVSNAPEAVSNSAAAEAAE